MRAGDLRRRITIQSRAATQDTFGQQTTTWVDLVDVPANISALSGQELLIAQAVNASVTHSISIRYTALLADPVKVAAMRAKYVVGTVTRYFSIVSSINVDERQKEIVLKAIEGADQG